MSIEFMIFIIALVIVIVFYKSFYSFVYFTVIVDIFLRIVTYLKDNLLRADAFSFLNYIPESVAAIIKGWDVGVFTEVLMFLYVVIYTIFLVLTIIKFVKKKF